MRRAITGLAVLALAMGMVGGAAAQERGRDREDERGERRGRVEQRRGDGAVRESIIVGKRDGRRAVRFDRRDIRVDRRGIRLDRRDTRLDRRDSRLDRRGRFDPRYRAGRRGPAFCRSGAGHPVWGRRWCLEKGFGLGGGYYGYDRYDRFGRFGRYDRFGRYGYRRARIGRSLPEIIFGRRYLDPGYRYRRAILGRAGLGEILGLVAADYLLYEVLGLSPYDGLRVHGYWRDGRFYDHRRSAYWQAGYRSPEHSDALALELLLEGERVAELTDFDRDGVVDLLLTRR